MLKLDLNSIKVAHYVLLALRCFTEKSIGLAGSETYEVLQSTLPKLTL